MSMDVQVILRLVDQLSGPAKQAAQSMRQLVIATQALQKSGGLGLLPQQIRDASASLRALQADVRSFSSAFRAATDSARGLSNAMAANRGRSWIKDEIAQLRALINLEKQYGAGLRSRGGRGLGIGHYGGIYGLAYGAHRVGHGLGVGLRQAGMLQAELSYLDILGISPEQQKRIHEQAKRTAKLVPTVTTAETLRTFREMRYAFADENHAIESMVDMAKFETAISALVPDASKAEQLRRQTYEMVKSAELRNQIKSPEEFRRFQDMILRAAHASGGIVDPSSIFQAFKYSRGALHGYDDEFTSLFLPEIVQELQTGRGGGGRGGAGSSLAAFKRMFVDQTFALKYVPEMLRLGLVDPAKVIRNDKGDIKGLMSGAIIGQDTAARNPFRYMERYLLPALEKAGVNVKDHAEVVKAIAALGGTELAKQLNQLMLIQREQMEKRAEMTKQVMGVEGSYRRVLWNYNTSLDAMKRQFEDMNANVLKPFLPTLTKLQNALTTFMVGIKSIAENFQKEIETVAPALLIGGAAGAGWLAKRLLFGGGAALGGRMLLGAGAGLLLGGGIHGALLGGGLAAALSKTGNAAASAATGVSTLGKDIASLGKSVSTLLNPLTAALGILEAAVWLRKNTQLLDSEPGGSDKYQSDKNSRARFHAALREQRKTIPGLPEYDPTLRGPVTEVPYGPQPKLTLPGIHDAIAGGDEAARAWLRSFSGTNGADLPKHIKDAANIDLSAEGARAGRSYGEAFLNAARSYISQLGSIFAGGGGPMPRGDGHLGDGNR